MSYQFVRNWHVLTVIKRNKKSSEQVEYQEELKCLPCQQQAGLISPWLSELTTHTIVETKQPQY